ncbi:rod shape-determining protein RodA [Minwuia thermotolerans]|uniref:Peptidoglycan glycosyltransferase MrdB n=1 Tax=Minwuia thermotolerans TaxID=2056226 RepID=A0A2M9G612_9PROT|nr:rod shape-determining protein RodA [Minwuia thermotolerans]PJK31151.1 rod shape-determining protein RodA [Minwuia thermotolerans]
MTYRRGDAHLGLGRKLLALNWGLVVLLALVAGIGFAMLYSAANGSLEPWAIRQMMRFGVGLALMVVIALIDIRFWMRWAYLIYFGALVLLIGVEVAGTTGMGATRWISLGFINLQPSELMKIALVLALARYFHGLSLEEAGRVLWLVPPLLLIAVPTALVLRQPDLGTALLLAAGGAVIFFLAGVRIWKFALAIAVAVAALPIAWSQLHDYQKGRVMTFFNPERDPLGAGYHILQSKIALGSGGVSGKGFLEGTQSHLNFLPEMRTDFIFTMLAEEFGMMGGLALLAIYTLILIYAYVIGFRSRNQFGRLVAIGIAATFFLYVFINVGMVTGILPVVGVPLPLISYGGTAMLTLLIGFGLILSVSIHRQVEIPRASG